MKPLKFKSAPIGTIWGSEDWILSAMEGRECVCITEGDEAKRLSELVAEYGDRLLGKRVREKYGDRFPLLIKYINSHQQLSVQVHPGDEMAARKGLPNGKTEMWYVLKAEKDAELLLGFSKRLDSSEYEKVVRASINEKDVRKGEKSLEDLLNRFRARRGDWYFIPAGTVHSIGAGFCILEIQQPSDTTYRLYDFNRVDIEGKKRHLDVEDALQAIDFDETQEEFVEKQRNVSESSSAICPLARCKYFVSNFIDFDRFCRPECGAENFFHLDNTRWGTFTVIVCTGGEGTLFYKEFGSGCIRSSVPLKDGDLYLIPAELGAVDIRSAGGLQLVEAHIENGG